MRVLLRVCCKLSAIFEHVPFQMVNFEKVNGGFGLFATLARFPGNDFRIGANRAFVDGIVNFSYLIRTTWARIRAFVRRFFIFGPSKTSRGRAPPRT